MKGSTMLRLAESIQLLKLDGFEDYSMIQLSMVSGINRKTLQRASVIITILDFALSKERFNRCIAYL